MTRYVAEHLNPHFGYFYPIAASLVRGKTRYQDLEVVDTAEFGKVLLLDGVTQVGERDDFLYHEPMVHPALCSHPDPGSVLVIGAGDGGIAREVLKHGPRRVVMCELDGEVVQFCRQHLPGISAGAFDDPRLELVIGDGRAYVESTNERFDAIIMDMTDPFGPSAMLYTREFFAAVKARLRDRRGSFVMHVENPIARPRTYQQILRTLGGVFRRIHVFYIYIHMYSMYWAIAVCCEHDRPARISRKAIAAVLKDRKIGELQAYSPETHHAMQVEFPYVSRLRGQAGTVPMITDAEHVVLDAIDLNRDQAALAAALPLGD